VIVANVGLNGVLIHENDNHVTFTLQALANAGHRPAHCAIW
jgi:hypothetical protein